MDLVNETAWRENLSQVGRSVEVMFADGEGRKDSATSRMSGRARDNRLVHVTASEDARDRVPGTSPRSSPPMRRHITSRRTPDYSTYGGRLAEMHGRSACSRLMQLDARFPSVCRLWECQRGVLRCRSAAVRPAEKCLHLG